MSAAAKNGLVAAIGLMSGTSMDGVDAALIWTDGVSAVRTGAALTVPFARLAPTGTDVFECRLGALPGLSGTRSPAAI